MKVVAIVGMPGAGKSEAAKLFEENDFRRIRFGDITDEEIKKQGLELNEENERRIREQLRKNYGMAAYAMLNLSRIDLALKKSPVVIDGLYSWEEYTFLGNYYRNRFGVVAVWSSPKTRYARLANRGKRPLAEEEATSRDKAEIEKLNKSGPIAMADFTIINEATLKGLKREVKKIITALRRQD
ncbi:MAG: AAA family ATPase [Chloroflexota bacterium]